ncbi:MAG TPA: helix-turn-helix domain-containing protein [Negativicutes bacterium]|nr:helix-turn-helix domain-containing protein [Negativicutes bacterium]
MEFGYYLKELMDQKGIGVNELANLSGISGAHISRIASGKRSAPSPQTLKKLSIALGVDYSELMNMAGHVDAINQSSKAPTEDKRPKELLKVLEQSEVMFDGETYKLNDEDKKKSKLHLN